MQVVEEEVRMVQYKVPVVLVVAALAEELPLLPILYQDPLVLVVVVEEEQEVVHLSLTPLLDLLVQTVVPVS
jgi:hypothetical protein